MEIQGTSFFLIKWTHDLILLWVIIYNSVRKISVPCVQIRIGSRVSTGVYEKWNPLQES